MSTVYEMYKRFEILMGEGHGEKEVYIVDSSSGVSYQAETPFIQLNEEGLFDAGELCEEHIGEEVAIIST